jgi:hypothetical protein
MYAFKLTLITTIPLNTSSFDCTLGMYRLGSFNNLMLRPMCKDHSVFQLSYFTVTCYIIEFFPNKIPNQCQDGLAGWAYWQFSTSKRVYSVEPFNIFQTPTFPVADHKSYKMVDSWNTCPPEGAWPGGRIRVGMNDQDTLHIRKMIPNLIYTYVLRYLGKLGLDVVYMK